MSQLYSKENQEIAEKRKKQKRGSLSQVCFKEDEEIEENWIKQVCSTQNSKTIEERRRKDRRHQRQTKLLKKQTKENTKLG